MSKRLFCLTLTCLFYYGKCFSQVTNFSTYSAFVPYATEREALTYKKETSSYVSVLSEGWQYANNTYEHSVKLPAGWRRHKLFIHFPGASFHYQVKINDTLRQDFNPLKLLPNELELPNLDTFKISVIVPDKEQIKFDDTYLYTVNDIHLSEIHVNGTIVDGKPSIFVNVRKVSTVPNSQRYCRYKIAIYDSKNANLATLFSGFVDERRGAYTDSLRGTNDYYGFGSQIDQAKPWTAETPNLYRLTLQVKDNKNNLVEVFSTLVGFRKPRTDGPSILLNNRPIKLMGVSFLEVEADKIESEIIQLKRNNVNAIKLSPDDYNPDLLSLCDKYGLYVVAGADNTQLSWFRNYFSLIQNYSSVIGIFSNTILHLKDSIEKVSKAHNIWKGCIDFNIKTLPGDTSILRRLISSASLWPLVLESKTTSLMASSIMNSSTGGLCGLFQGNQVSAELLEMYQPLNFELVSAITNTYSIVNRQSFASTDSIEFRYETFNDGEKTIDAKLDVPTLKAGQVVQIKLPDFKADCMMLYAIRNSRTLGRWRIASTDFRMK